MPLIALTGGIAAGKSTVAARLAELGAVIVDADTGDILTVAELARQLANTDVVVTGEYHGHHASHLLQARLQQALYRHHPRQTLSTVQFNLNHQDALGAYLAGQTGETEMIEDAGAWENYKGSYRPLVEFAREHQLPVVAANAPADIVRCVGREGMDYLQRLPDAQRAALPDNGDGLEIHVLRLKVNSQGSYDLYVALGLLPYAQAQGQDYLWSPFITFHDPQSGNIVTQAGYSGHPKPCAYGDELAMNLEEMGHIPPAPERDRRMCR